MTILYVYGATLADLHRHLTAAFGPTAEELARARGERWEDLGEAFTILFENCSLAVMEEDGDHELCFSGAGAAAAMLRVVEALQGHGLEVRPICEPTEEELLEMGADPIRAYEMANGLVRPCERIMHEGETSEQARIRCLVDELEQLVRNGKLTTRTFGSCAGRALVVLAEADLGVEELATILAFVEKLPE